MDEKKNLIEEYLRKEFSDGWSIDIKDEKIYAYYNKEKRFELYFDCDTESWMIHDGKFVCLDMIFEVIEIIQPVDEE